MKTAPIYFLYGLFLVLQVQAQATGKWGTFPRASKATHPFDFAILSESTSMAHNRCTAVSRIYGELVNWPNTRLYGVSSQ